MHPCLRRECILDIRVEYAFFLSVSPRSRVSVRCSTIHWFSTFPSLGDPSSEHPVSHPQQRRVCQGHRERRQQQSSESPCRQPQASGRRKSQNSLSRDGHQWERVHHQGWVHESRKETSRSRFLVELSEYVLCGNVCYVNYSLTNGLQGACVHGC